MGLIFRLTRMNRKVVNRNVEHALAPKFQVSLLGKHLGLQICIVTVHAITRTFIQVVGKKLEADLADLKNRLKMQEMETRKANAKFVSSIASQEKLKTEFDAERKAWAEEKAALVNRADQAERALSEKTAELSGLKRQVSQMVAAIFGKSSAGFHPVSNFDAS